MNMLSLREELAGNTYPGRGIVIGRSKDGKTAVSDVWTKDALQVFGADEQRPVRATHGYEPELGPQPVFMAHGPAFKENVSVPNAKLVDIAPTLAKVLGQELPEAEGRCLTELLK